MSKRIYDGRLVAILFALVATLFSALGAASLEMLSTPFQVALPFCVGAIVFLAFEYTLQRSEATSEIPRRIAQVISAILLALLAVCFYTATRSLWIGPGDTFADRFVYENTATATGFAAALTTLLLSTLGRDRYWVARKPEAALDERELKDRLLVIEKSYKIAAVISIAGLWFFAQTIHNIPAILAINTGQVPGHLFWLPGCFVMALFALPPVIGAWKKQ